MSPKSKPTTLKAQMAELDTVLSWFEQDEIDLERAVAQFELALQLAEAIKTRLQDIENKVTVLKERFNHLSGE